MAARASKTCPSTGVIKVTSMDGQALADDIADLQDLVRCFLRADLRLADDLSCSLLVLSHCIPIWLRIIAFSTNSCCCRRVLKASEVHLLLLGGLLLSATLALRLRCKTWLDIALSTLAEAFTIPIEEGRNLSSPRSHHQLGLGASQVLHTPIHRLNISIHLGELISKLVLLNFYTASIGS